MADARRFPIMRCGTVPWEDAEIAYRHDRANNDGSQSLERIAERGGYSLGEFCLLYCDVYPLGPVEFQPERLDAAMVAVARKIGDDWALPEPVGLRHKDGGKCINPRCGRAHLYPAT